LLRICEVMKRASTEDDIERLVEERQRLGIRLLQQNIGDTRVTKPLRAHPEQGRGQIDTNDLSHHRRDRIRRVRRSTRDIKNDHVGGERLDPRKRPGGARRERRIWPREEPHLALEGTTYDLVVPTGNHARIMPDPEHSTDTDRSLFVVKGCVGRVCGRVRSPRDVMRLWA
jgi:hypothetical protein